ncbi:MAG: hypothetical protein U0835_23790 [Isosphaeraceae bacterium]
MSLFTRRASLATLLSFALAAPAALAASPMKLSAPLVGPRIGAITPKGKVKVDQSKLPREAPEFQVEVENVNLPNGTVLVVVLNGHPVGTLNILAGRAKLTTTLAGTVASNSTVLVLFNDVTILANSGPLVP